MDMETLVRIQFGFGIACHIVFPTITIGLAWLLVYCEYRSRRNGAAHWMQLYDFWAPVFAVSFLFGIATGLLQGMQLATRFDPFNHVAGPILGPLRWAEGWLPLALELIAIGIMLFGGKRVDRHAHFAATIFTALALTNAAFWIICANSWMQTPQGMYWRNGQWHAQNWAAVIFTPSFLQRFAHVLIATLLSTALVVAAVCAVHWRQTRSACARYGLRTAVVALAVLACLQFAAGHLSGQVVAEKQPAKLAAMEGLWHGGRDVPFVVLAMPDPQAMANRHALEIPYGASLLLTHDRHGYIQGLDAFAPRDRPPIVPVFFGFRLMVALGCWLLGLGLSGVWLLARGRLERSPRYLRALGWSWPLGFVATIAGWTVTEVGRQPWLIGGLLRTSDGISAELIGDDVASSLRFMVAAYVLLFVFYGYLLLRLLKPRDYQAAPSPAMLGTL